VDGAARLKTDANAATPKLSPGLQSSAWFGWFITRLARLDRIPPCLPGAVVAILRHRRGGVRWQTTYNCRLTHLLYLPHLTAFSWRRHRHGTEHRHGVGDALQNNSGTATYSTCVSVTFHRCHGARHYHVGGLLVEPVGPPATAGGWNVTDAPLGSSGSHFPDYPFTYHPIPPRIC